MSVKIRLAKKGRKKLAMFDIVVSDSRSPRDGKFIEKIGTYNPNTHPISVTMKDDRAFYWIMEGAEPTDTTRMVLSERGLLFKKHLQIGVNKKAITQETADARLEEWKAKKVTAEATRAANELQAKSSDKKAKLQAETVVNAKRAEAIKLKKAVQEIQPVAEEAAAETPSETPAE